MKMYVTLSSKCLKGNMKVLIDDITFYANEPFEVDGIIVSREDETGGCVHLDFAIQGAIFSGEDEVTIRLKECRPWIEDDRHPEHFDISIIKDKLRYGVFDIVCPYVTVNDQQVTIEDFKVTALKVVVNGTKFEPNIEKMTVEV